jgi:transcriptional regulator with XRE-family HTH domain
VSVLTAVAGDDDDHEARAPEPTASAAAAAPTASAAAAAVGEHSRRDDLGDFIRKQREQAKLSLRNLSKIAGVSNPYLSQIERGLRNPSAEILQAIAKALDLSAETLYVRAGILDERGDGDVESAIARDGYLTEHQRATLIEMYRTFRSVSGLKPAAAAPAQQPAAGPVPAAALAAPVQEDDRPPRVVHRVIEAITTGDVSDQDIASVVAAQEDPDEA